MAGRLFPAGGGKSIQLTKPAMLIGRSPKCDIQLDHAIVSTRHCMLIFDGHTWSIQDLGSRNGTRVNNVWIQIQNLKSGDTIAIASTLRFVIEFDPAVELKRFIASGVDGQSILAGDDRSFAEHGPATKRLEPHDKDVWSEFDK